MSKTTSRNAVTSDVGYPAVPAFAGHHDDLDGGAGLARPEIQRCFRCQAIVAAKTFLQVQAEECPEVPVPQSRVTGLYARWGLKIPPLHHLHQAACLDEKPSLSLS